MTKRSQKTSSGNNGSKDDAIAQLAADAVPVDTVPVDTVPAEISEADAAAVEADAAAAKADAAAAKAATQRVEDWSATLFHLSSVAEILVRLDTGVISDRIVKQLGNVNRRVRKLARLDTNREENRTKRLDTLKKKLTKLKTAASKLDVDLDTL